MTSSSRLTWRDYITGVGFDTTDQRRRSHGAAPRLPRRKRLGHGPRENVAASHERPVVAINLAACRSFRAHVEPRLGGWWRDAGAIPAELSSNQDRREEAREVELGCPMARIWPRVFVPSPPDTPPFLYPRISRRPSIPCCERTRPRRILLSRSPFPTAPTPVPTNSSASPDKTP